MYNDVNEFTAVLLISLCIMAIGPQFIRAYTVLLISLCIMAIGPQFIRVYLYLL